MTYTGSVIPGGPSAVRTLGGLTIRKASVSEMDNNVYLLTCATTGAQALVDAADDAPRILGLLQEGTGRLDLVVTTHQHWDHHRALAEVLAATSATSAAGAADADALPVRPDRRLEHGDTLTFGDVTLDVIHLRGHTPGSIALAWTEPSGATHLFTGDSLFPGGVGNVNKDPERFASLLADVEERVFDRYDDRTWVYPGHGADTTLGAERPSLPQWRERGW
jgi:glyoxylase-like metal-dependent hydrolase (beta-lactamase superfamily II)